MFCMKLINVNSLESISNEVYDVREYDYELDDERSVICDICEIFQNSKVVVFIISGFGGGNWPVDCQVDLSVVIEQLPQILRKIKDNNYNFVLDLYEQGMEREITFEGYGNKVSIECISRIGWEPVPNKIIMKKEEINKIFKDLYNNFIYFSEYLCLDLIKDPLLSEWIKL